MANIFELGSQLQRIFEVIEENDGELTPELEEELNITSENFKDKIEAYCQVLTIYNSDVECCKNEKNRVNSIQNIKKNTIERIKQKLLEAVELFGEIGKTGNKVIETPTRKLFTKGSTSIEEKETRKTKLVQYVLQSLTELQKEGILELGENIDVAGFLASINAIAKADYEMPDEFGNTPVEEFEPYTSADLQAITINCSFEKSLASILSSHANLGYFIATNPIDCQINSSVDKDIVKAMNKAELPVTVAQEVKKTSIVIK
ncbi:MAG: siphovirus Gp157 family protein [Lachnospiraceae bacterium]|nr:siphovirus Gp157 family protein [Lachnospiraceae bacterium]